MKLITYVMEYMKFMVKIQLIIYSKALNCRFATNDDEFNSYVDKNRNNRTNVTPNGA